MAAATGNYHFNKNTHPRGRKGGEGLPRVRVRIPTLRNYVQLFAMQKLREETMHHLDALHVLLDCRQQQG